MAEAFNPLNMSHATRLNKACEECARIKAYLDKLERAGMPVEPQRQHISAVHERALAIKREFFPGLS